jgi:hypothetical protein
MSVEMAAKGSPDGVGFPCTGRRENSKVFSSPGSWASDRGDGTAWARRHAPKVRVERTFMPFIESPRSDRRVLGETQSYFEMRKLGTMPGTSVQIRKSAALPTS